MLTLAFSVGLGSGAPMPEFLGGALKGYMQSAAGLHLPNLDPWMRSAGGHEQVHFALLPPCLLYTSDAADE